jgi:D-tyrosyl-tRNA(Tyr) deacylase
MRILLQRVKRASVTIDGRLHGSIEHGLLALVGFCESDKEEYILPMAQKMAGLRIFEDENEKMNLSVGDVDGDILAVSQFTLYADCSHGRRPSFTGALKPDMAEVYYNKFVKTLAEITGRDIATGVFGADMKVELLNDGPVTVMLDSEDIIKK